MNKRTILSIICCIAVIYAFSQNKPKNVILMIGDGMGMAQVNTLYYLNPNSALWQFPYRGTSMTYCLSDSITDSAAGGSALSTGKKTTKGYIALNRDSTANETLMEWAIKQKMATGIVVTSAMTDATPASFYAHVPNRSQYEEIAKQFIYSNIDFAVGGYLNNFLPNKRKDKLNLIDSLEQKGYQIIYSLEDLLKATDMKTVGFLSEKKPPKAAKRGNWLAEATRQALEKLAKDPQGFVLMIEGSQIDWACHVNDYKYFKQEILDFDRAIKVVYDFAKTNQETLVVVTADHECGGMTLSPRINNLSKEKAARYLVNYVLFSSLYHTNADVPVFSFGPGADNFQGKMNNIDIHDKIIRLINNR